MATYAVKGGSADVIGVGGTVTYMRPKSPLRKVDAWLGNKKEMRADRRIILTLLGVVAGSTATETLKRISYPLSGEMGGKRTIETENLVNRATTAGDVTDLTAAYLVYNSRPTYAVDKASRF